MKKIIKLLSHEYFYIHLIILSVIQLYIITDIRMGVSIAVMVIIYSIFEVNKRLVLKNVMINKLIMVFVVYNTISACLYLINDVPISVYFAEFSNFIIPILFFYLSLSNKNLSNKFYNVTFYALLISFIFSYWLWINGSEEYRIYMNTVEGLGTDLLNFQSLFGLTATGALGVVGLALVLTLFDKNQKTLAIICSLIFMVFVFLTFRRSSLVMAIFVLLAIHIYIYFYLRTFPKSYFIFEIILLISGLTVLLNIFIPEDFYNIINRVADIKAAVLDRSHSWSYAFNFQSLILGKGLGASGHKALNYSNEIIADGNYFKILSEVGLFGLITFLLIIILSVIKAITNFRIYAIPLLIIIAIAGIATGSNIFSYPSVTPLFWYSVGCIWKDKIIFSCATLDVKKH